MTDKKIADEEWFMVRNFGHSTFLCFFLGVICYSFCQSVENNAWADEIDRFVDVSVRTRLEAVGGRLRVATSNSPGTVADRFIVANFSGNSVTNETMPLLAQVNALKYLHFHNTRVSANGLAAVGKLRDLSYLSLFGPSFDDRGIEQLVTLDTLETLVLDGASISDVGMATIAAMPSLRVLDLRRLKIGDSGIERLCGHAKLESLSLDRICITDAALANLKRCKRLKSVRLGEGAKISAVGVRSLAGCDLLETCFISHVSDLEMQELGKLERLETLGVDGDKISDEGLQHLHNLKRLKVLTVRGAVTKEAILELHDALPNTRVTVNPRL